MIMQRPNGKCIKGVYIIRSSKSGNSKCTYNSNQGFHTLDTCNDFREDFDPNSKIVVFLDSFTSSIDVHLHILKRQKIQFIRKPNDLRLLENQNKLRILATKEIINKADLTTELSSTDDRGALFDSTDSDLFIIGFNETLPIKQEGDVPENLSAITIQPMSEKVEISIDDSVDMKKQKVKIDTEQKMNVSVSIVTNITIENEVIFNNFLSYDREKVTVKFGNDEVVPTDEIIIPTTVPEIITLTKEIIKENPTAKPEETKSLDKKSKGLPIGIIVGIIIAVIFVIVIVALIIIFLKKKRINISHILKSEISSDSIGI